VQEVVAPVTQQSLPIAHYFLSLRLADVIFTVGETYEI